MNESQSKSVTILIFGVEAREVDIEGLTRFKKETPVSLPIDIAYRFESFVATEKGEGLVRLGIRTVFRNDADEVIAHADVACDYVIRSYERLVQAEGAYILPKPLAEFLIADAYATTRGIVVAKLGTSVSATAIPPLMVADEFDVRGDVALRLESETPTSPPADPQN